jgi:hypothetical protein
LHEQKQGETKVNKPFGFEAASAGVTLWNPTKEDFTMEYQGLTLHLLAGEKHPTTVKCANHLLNSFGQRGLTSLTYGCDEKQVEADAIQRNHDFKMNMIRRYNETNGANKVKGLPYQLPTKTIKGYALELGIELLEPYTMKDAEREAISKSTRENEELKAKLAAQDVAMTEMKTMLKQLMEAKPVQKQEETEKSELRVRKDGVWRKE